MEINLLLLQVATLFLPGLIWARLDAKYAQKVKPTDVEFVIRTFIFGLVSYGATFVFYKVCHWPFTIVDLTTADQKSVLNGQIAGEIIWATAIGFMLAVLWIYSSTYKWLTRFLQLIRATKTYGDEDVWDFTFNSPVPNVEYVNVRDFTNKIVYTGYVRTFSETDKLRELVLRDAQVYNFEAQRLFEVPLLYLARSPDCIHIEFPYRPADGGAK